MWRRIVCWASKVYIFFFELHLKSNVQVEIEMFYWTIECSKGIVGFNLPCTLKFDENYVYITGKQGKQPFFVYVKPVEWLLHVWYPK